MRRVYLSLLRLLPLAVLPLASPASSGASSISTTSISRLPLAFLRKNKEYTPLLFFTAPKGAQPECDFVGKMVSQVEKELGVKVERLDVLKDRNARMLYDKIDVGSKQQLPMLYHRESRQSVLGMTDKNRVRAWAKGRWLSADYKPTLPSEFYRAEEGSAEDNGDELTEEEIARMEDDELSPLQRKGKREMKKRLEEGAKK